MKFYKVNKEADQIRINRPKKDWFLVANELITKAEAEKEGIIDILNTHAKVIELSKFKTSWFFGCRFESNS